MYEEKLIDAIETIVQNAVENAGYDKTILCQIIECVDPTIGKYKVRYQDSSFLAYSESADVTYMKGANVYVLVPGNDMSRDKTILSTTKKLGANYLGGSGEEDNKYEQVGTNCIDSSIEYEFCSYKSEAKIIYDKQNEINELNVNLRSIETYIKNSSSILCGGEFKTKLPNEQQFRGNFGIIFELSFLDNASQESVVRHYVIDVNQMLGNPYKQTKWTRQYGVFDLDTVNFQGINRIILFVNEFPHQRDGEPADIWIRNLEFCGVNATPANELDSYGLVFITPQGTYFDDNDLDSAKRTLQAQVRVKGKNIDNSSQNVEYYWFVENVGVTVNTPFYCNYGGQGWECKNKKNIVGTDENGNEIYEWVPADWEYIVTKSDSAAKETRYKCVAIYNDVILSKEITITNYSSDWEITVESDSGDQFFFDIGNPTLTCKVNGQLKNTDEFTYVWAEIDSVNNFTSLNPTTAENDEYNNAVAAYTQLKADIEAERAMAAASEEQLKQYLTIIEKYDKIMRVERMYVYHLQVNEIISFATYKCSVYYNGVYLGSGSIVIKNSLEKQGEYTLIINNGTQVFKYDEMGISPVNTSINLKTTLLPLTFTLYDNLGNEIDMDVLRTCDIKWVVPIDNTMLEIPEAYGEPAETDPEEGTATYENHMTAFSYLIAYKYDVSKTNNNIKLLIDYKGTTIAAKTNFTFIKEGEAGTNGTEFIAKIVPNVAGNEIPPVYPMILNGELNYTPRQANRWFRLQFWHNGEIIYNGESSGITNENKNISITWSMLANRYGKANDNSDIQVTDAQAGTFNYSGYNGSSSPANIVKCSIKYENAEYYDTIPVITATTSNGYKVGLKENTGFMYAVYSSDGLRPQYDNAHPFELIVTRMINGFEEDVSTLEQAEAITYTWTPRGKTYDSTQWVYGEYLLDTKKTTQKNQASYKPVDYYNGECVNIGLECTMTRSGTSIGRIHIPIHFYLNRYGQNAINDWDGNHIDINNSGNTILAPQMGAGQKESDNSFTGVLMGTVREYNKTDKDVGLFGYNHGNRSFYLNSKDGSAIFGYNNGQIIIDPSARKGLLYSHNFWKNTNYDTSGKPKNYDRSQENGQGLLIDLTTPEIRFGSGNFSVTKEGYLTAKGGGSIGGWNIEDGRLSSGNIQLDANGSIHHTGDAWSINQDGSARFSSGSIGNWSIYDGGISNGNVSLTREGNIVANGGTIGGWTINSNSLSSNQGHVIFSSEGNLDCYQGAGWHIRNDGTVSFGNYFNIDGNGNIRLGSNFTVGSDGVTSIGGWRITDHTLENGGIYLDSYGQLRGGTTYNWSINQNGDATFNSITANTRGNIAGWEIQNNGGLKVNSGEEGSTSYIYPDGRISFGNDWGWINCGKEGTWVNGNSWEYPVYINDGYRHARVVDDGKDAIIIRADYSGRIVIKGGDSLGNTAPNPAKLAEMGGHNRLMSDIYITSGGSTRIFNTFNTWIMSEQFSYLEAGNSAYVLAQSVGIGRCGAITDYSPAKWVYIGGEGTYVHIGDAGGEILFHVTPKYDIKTTVNDLPKISSLALQGDSFSTSNIKQNIIKRDVSDILSILDKMDIYDYNYIPEIYNGKQDYGYIIDYLEKIPGIEKYLEIAEEEVKGYKTKSIFNSSLIKFLLSSVIALNKEIKKIKGDK